MSVTQKQNDEKRDAPNGWHWGTGNRSSTHYTYWMYTDKALYPDGEFGYECQMWWDKGGKHHVHFIQYTKIRQDGDYEYDYPTHQRSFETEKEAIEYAVEKAAELR